MTDQVTIERIENVTVRDLDLAAFGFQLSERGLQPVGKPTFQQWLECGEILRTQLGYITREAQILQFAIGDWLTYGERTYGDQYSTALDATGYAYGTLANFKSVARSIESSRRNENLTFGHHQAVAALPPPKQTTFLQEAEAEQLSVRALRERVDADQGKPITTRDLVQCPACGATFEAGMNHAKTH